MTRRTSSNACRPFFVDEAAVDEDGIEEGDLDEAVSREDGRAREEGRADARVHEILTV